MLLDTSILIAILRNKTEAIEFVLKFKEEQFFTTEINIFELITGIYASSKNKYKHLKEIKEILSKIIILPLDRKASFKAGEIAGDLIKQGKIIEGTDSLIAGIALSNNINEIITINKKHFEKITDLKVYSY
jgi:tRNA(fMet)-specific endonuclease VapC